MLANVAEETVYIKTGQETISVFPRNQQTLKTQNKSKRALLNFGIGCQLAGTILSPTVGQFQLQQPLSITPIQQSKHLVSSNSQTVEIKVHGSDQFISFPVVLNSPKVQYTEVNVATSVIHEEANYMVRKKQYKTISKSVRSSIVSHGRIEKRPILDIVINDEIIPRKSRREITVPMSIEFGGRLPKRPLI